MEKHHSKMREEAGSLFLSIGCAVFQAGSSLEARKAEAQVEVEPGKEF